MAIRVSSSRLKTLTHCSLEFYYQEILKLPQSIHPRTQQGSCIHAIFEHIMHPKRLKFFKALMEMQTSVHNIPSIARYIRFYGYKHFMDPYEMPVMLDMLNIAFEGIRRHFVDAEGKWSPPPKWYNEKRFQLQVGQATISGFIDLLLVWEDRAIVIDLKSQRERFTKAELPNNIQSIMYMLSSHQEYGMIPTVDFILLRHPPTNRQPSRHIQRVDPFTESHLTGLRAYICHMYPIVNNFGIKEAMINPSDDYGFCTRVCHFHKPFDYYALVKKTDPSVILSTFLVDKVPQTIQDDEMLVEKRHEGCVFRWRQ